jgi:hypothetical protein
MRKDLLNSSGNNALVILRGLFGHLSAHSIGLAATSLAIGKDADIVTVNKALY